MLWNSVGVRGLGSDGLSDRMDCRWGLSMGTVDGERWDRCRWTDFWIDGIAVCLVYGLFDRWDRCGLFDRWDRCMGCSIVWIAVVVSLFVWTVRSMDCSIVGIAVVVCRCRCVYVDNGGCASSSTGGN